MTTMKEDFENAKATLVTVAPFISSLLRNARIVSSRGANTATSYPDGSIFINPDFFKQLNYTGKAWVLGHETLHIAFSHTKRIQRAEKRNAYNIAADAVTNLILNDLIRCPKDCYVTFYTRKGKEITRDLDSFSVHIDDVYSKISDFVDMDIDEFRRLSVGEIYEILCKVAQMMPPLPPQPQEEDFDFNIGPESKGDDDSLNDGSDNNNDGGDNNDSDSDGNGEGDGNSDSDDTSESESESDSGNEDDSNGKDSDQQPGADEGADDGKCRIGDIEVEKDMDTGGSSSSGGNEEQKQGQAQGGDSDGEGSSNNDEGVIQQGNPEIYDADSNEAEEKWREEIFKAYTAQKTAGHIPSGLKRMVDELFESHIGWRELLKQSFNSGMGKTIVSTWMRPSRKLKGMPGIKRFSYPTVYCMVDTSGSISEKELTAFISEVNAIAKNTEVVVIPWDAQSYTHVKGQGSNVIEKVKGALRGGGGTVLQPVLERVSEMMRPLDAAIILTDGGIFDLNQQETKTLLEKICQKSSVSVVCSTDRMPEIQGWEKIKVEVD